MKTYTIEVQSKNHRIVDVVEAKNPFFAVLETVFRFHHLGARLHNTSIIHEEQAN